MRLHMDTAWPMTWQLCIHGDELDAVQVKATSRQQSSAPSSHAQQLQYACSPSGSLPPLVDLRRCSILPSLGAASREKQAVVRCHSSACSHTPAAVDSRNCGSTTAGMASSDTDCNLC
jgi:hypothetical protein